MCSNNTLIQYGFKILFLSVLLLQTVHLEALENQHNTVFFKAGQGSLNLASFIEILVDPRQAFTIKDVMSEKRTNDFKLATEVGNSFAISKAAYWVRFTLHQDESPDQNLILQLAHPSIDHVTFFVPDDSGIMTEKLTGGWFPFEQREIKYRSFLFQLPQHSGQTRTYYLRLFSEGSMQIPLFLWTYEAFIEHVDKTGLLLGGYYGVMTLLFITALVSFFVVRDRLFISYALYLLSYLLFQLSVNGFSFQYLWPDYPSVSSRISAFFVGIVVFMALIFSGSFLQLWEKKNVHIRGFFYLLMVSSSAASFLSIFGPLSLSLKVGIISGILLPPVVLAGGLFSFINGYKPAKFFLIAWSFFLVGVFTKGLLHLGLLPNNFFTVYAIQLGSSFEVILLGYALIYRINLLNKEKETATQNAHTYLFQLNNDLEALVEKRTKQLEEKNKQLSELAMRDSMTGMLNHNATIEYLGIMLHSAKRYKKELAVIMLDIDLFKSVNDHYGHLAGDRVLIAIAEVIKVSIRESDICGRYGGEEFLLVLDGSDDMNAMELAERIRHNIMNLKIPEINNTGLTVSLGVTVLMEKDTDESLIAKADSALYKAKQTGRNKAVMYESHQDII